MGESSRREGLWTADQRPGGPFDSLVDELRRRVPGLVVERLIVSHGGDDDNVYFIGDQDGRGRVQAGTWPDGRPPFLIEDEDGGSAETSDPQEAAAIICAWLDRVRPDPRS
jgi:hypothetical protein